MIGSIIETVIDVAFERTGRRLFGLVGMRPPALVTIFTGMLLWAAVAILVLHIAR
ncbi:hypothetical protein [Tardiphaga alba]|uniref:hypothetical protein n=1 Tax=Tardiphaga alba TaxID=340268 RepID=UPI001BA68BD3|nr:hypothetical protein [Tardiphaga alba]